METSSALPVVAGLQPYEWLTLIGIVIGPIVAVLISLWIEGRRKDRDQKLVILRTLLATRHLVGDPTYSAAINLIPIEFAAHRKVLVAHKAYMEAVRFRPTPENQEAALKQTIAKQSKLVFEIARCMGFDIAESDIQVEGYAADAWIRRDLLGLDAQQATRDIASILAIQTKLLAQQQVSSEEGQFIENKVPRSNDHKPTED